MVGCNSKKMPASQDFKTILKTKTKQSKKKNFKERHNHSLNAGLVDFYIICSISVNFMNLPEIEYSLFQGILLKCQIKVIQS